MASQEESTTTPAVQSPGAHEIRITSGGKMNLWVDFALKFFAENAERPLALHTLPAPRKEPTKARAIVDDRSEEENAEVNDDDNDDIVLDPKNDTRTNGKKKTISPSTAAIPKLVSVVEIIKREYLKSSTADGGLVGLYQYNELGSLEDVEDALAEGDAVGDGEEDRAKMLAAALESTNVRIKRTPYMKVTLCRKELPSLAPAATAQRPEKRKMSKSARGRLKKRLKKSAEAAGTSEQGAIEDKRREKGNVQEKDK